MTTGELIRHFRQIRGLTQKQLGEQCGIAEPTIRRYELGKLNPKIQTLQRIADALEISWEQLLENPPKNPSSEEICKNLAKNLGIPWSTEMTLEYLMHELNLQAVKTHINPSSTNFKLNPSITMPSCNVTSAEKELIQLSRRLNQKGFQALVEHAYLLTEVPRYQKNTDES